MRHTRRTGQASALVGMNDSYREVKPGLRVSGALPPSQSTVAPEYGSDYSLHWRVGTGY
jgi:hypothetical protein